MDGISGVRKELTQQLGFLWWNDHQPGSAAQINIHTFTPRLPICKTQRLEGVG